MQIASRRRKAIEDLVVDGLIDSTKKILSLEDELTVSTNNKHRIIKSFQPKTENQKAFVELMRDDSVDILIATGPAGTGKTMLACYAGVEALRLKKINKIVVTRPVVSVDEEIGFLPGGLESKMDPWTRPIFDILRETYSAKEIERMTEEGIIEIVPLGFMRGRTFKNAWILADEMQNSSPTQMFMLATRIGEGSKMIITGDLNQSDLNPKSNGLLEIYHKVRKAERTKPLDYVRYVELEKEDVQRSRAAKKILDIYEPESDLLPDSNRSVSVTQLVEDPQPVEDTQSVEDLRPVEDLQPESDSNLPVSDPNPVIDPQPLSNNVEANDSPNSKKLHFEWVDINDDAALIPLKHIQQLKKNL
jgi:phosphate starvation-inducible PhoH-like protein